MTSDFASAEQVAPCQVLIVSTKLRTCNLCGSLDRCGACKAQDDRVDQSWPQTSKLTVSNPVQANCFDQIKDK